MRRQQAFCWVIASIMVMAAMWGVATEVQACGGGFNIEPSGNTPEGWKLAGPAITGTMYFHDQEVQVNPYTGKIYYVGTLDFTGQCKGKPVEYTMEFKNDVSLDQFTKNCQTDVETCAAQGGFIEGLRLSMSTDLYNALVNANCDDIFYRADAGIELFVQAVPAFGYDTGAEALLADVVILFIYQ